MVSKWGWRIVAQGAAGKKYILNYNIFSMEYKGNAVSYYYIGCLFVLEWI